VELLSRLIVRLAEFKAREAFHRALVFSKDLQWAHWWLFEPLGHLLKRSFTAISPEARKGFLWDVLNFPLPDERAIEGIEHRWPELIELLDVRSIARPPDDGNFGQRIGVLIDKVRSATVFSRSRAALRLTHLFEAGALKAQETQQFGEALWTRRNTDNAFPSDTQLLPHVFLNLPCPDIALPKRVFREQILNPLTREGVTSDRLTALIGAARQHEDGSKAFNFTTDEAKAILDAILAWHQRVVEYDFLGDVLTSNRSIEKAIGRVLAEVALPILDPTNIDSERTDKLFNMIENTVAQSAISALPEFSRLDPLRQDQIVHLIRRSLTSSNGDTAFFAFNAIYRWRKRAWDGALQACPIELIQEVMAIAITRREPGLLHSLFLIANFLDDGILSQDDQLRMVDVLDALHTETAYEFWPIEDPRTTTLTLMRARCVRLAHKLKTAGLNHSALTAWINLADTDPIPEVRYALEEAE
jgi:hypothetical protein